MPNPALPKLSTPVQLVLGVLLWVLLYRSLLPFWNWLMLDIFGLNMHIQWVESLHFFLYDTTKIFLLLGGIIFVVSLVRSFFSVEKTREWLSGRRSITGHVLAALMGIVTPFCSCSAVPAFIGFVAAGVPLGVTFSFLIASPLINEIAVGLLYILFGWKIAVLYVISGLILAIGAGYGIGMLKLERHVEAFVLQARVGNTTFDPSQGITWQDRLRIASEEVQNTVRKVWLYVLIGIALGAVIHGWVPNTFFERYAGKDNPFAVLVAVLLGIPLYSNASGILPLVETLYQKGIPMGTLLAFMMSVVALSLPEMILLRRVLKLPLIAVFAGTVAVGIIVIGYVFNAILA